MSKSNWRLNRNKGVKKKNESNQHQSGSRYLFNAHGTIVFNELDGNKRKALVIYMIL